APTKKAAANLVGEGVQKDRVFVTGNTVIDALLEVVQKLASNPALSDQFDEEFGIDPTKRLVLVTGHRRESFGAGFDRICGAIVNLAQREDLQIIYPVHLNPSVRGPVERQLRMLERVSLISPQDYLPFVHLMRRSHIILTDSGGVQEEAPSLGKPVLVMRDTTERPEAVEAGTVKLVGTDVALILAEAKELLDNDGHYRTMSGAHNPYGDGQAAGRIQNLIASFFDRNGDEIGF
ncbi:UDP-N-acetylglucosamine 2-epimerase (non-hydrolyzing), partial [Luminiphilus sp.]|nr:UDP-N-acetylglucosamine 2-epimerase (non-hydrolyzing) [Luminiphilus sp.]